MNLLKDEETNPFCQQAPGALSHSPATNKEKVIEPFGGTGI